MSRIRGCERFCPVSRTDDSPGFNPVKLICAVMSSSPETIASGKERLAELFGEIDAVSPLLPFDKTDYYEEQMGADLSRLFLSFTEIISPIEISNIKIRTNLLEAEMKKEAGSNRRVINLDPGYMTPSALIMATTKDFSHRIPLSEGIYAHLEFLFGKNDLRFLDWTYPDLRSDKYRAFFLNVRRTYLRQLRMRRTPSRG